MDRLTFASAIFFSLMIATSGSMSAARAAARKGYHPRWGALAGAVAGFAGGLLLAGILTVLFSINGPVVGLGSLVGGIAALVALARLIPDRHQDWGNLPGGNAFKLNIQARHIQGAVMRWLLIFSIALALFALVTLLWSIINKSFGLTAVQYAVEPEDLEIDGTPVNRSLDQLSTDELEAVLASYVRVARLRVFILDDVADTAQTEWAALSPQPISDVLKGHQYPAELAQTPLNTITALDGARILAMNLGRDKLEALIYTEIIKPEVVASWPLVDSLTGRDRINATAADKYPKAELKWRSWVNRNFITGALDPRRPDITGIRPALYGSLMVIAITIVIAFPVGVGAAIYLEEYAGQNRLNQIIQTNINNLAGVPSIIYGMLGLAIFVRAMQTITSGNAFGTDTANGRTIFSAGLTLALLILPMLIINAQEAIRAVPNSLRQASYGLGATHWQTIWHHVLPYAMPGILTGTILAISRAIGETAPLILVGGATYLTQDPQGPFSIFTALPLLIYRWTTLPQEEFRNAAAAAIIVLLLMLLTLNSVAVILRNRFSRRLS